MKGQNHENGETRPMRERVLVRDPETRSLFVSFRNLSLHLTAVQDDKISLFKNLFCKQSPKTCRPELASGPQKAFTLAEVLMAKRMSDKTCSQEFVRMSEPKAPTNIFNKLCAFTLAEVLITLAIIGVVAALTIPTVVRNYQERQTVTQVKKVFSTLN